MTLTGGMSLPKEVIQTVYAWGLNGTNGAVGALGLNDNLNRSSPTQLGAAGSTWVSISSNSGIVSGIKSDGTLWTWGDGTNGSGVGDIISRSSPVQVGILTNWSVSTSTFSTTIARKTDGTLWGWGYNTYGQLGLGDTVARSSPVQIGLLNTWTNKLTSYNGLWNTFAIKSDGTLWSWGYSGSGQLGLNDLVNRSSPVQVGTDTNWSSIFTGGVGFGVRTDGTLWSWGGTNNGQLGLNIQTAYRSSPTQVGLLTDWLNAKTGGNGLNPLIIKSNGTLWTWGAGSSVPSAAGAMGDGSAVSRSSPIQIGSLNTWTSVSSGGGGASATRSDNTLWSWGQNLYGGIGDNTLIARSSPVQIGGATWTNAILYGSAAVWAITTSQ
jgi:alpha-tubulin suppressor-like RCC1 family protein